MRLCLGIYYILGSIAILEFYIIIMINRAKSGRDRNLIKKCSQKCFEIWVNFDFMEFIAFFSEELIEILCLECPSGEPEQCYRSFCTMLLDVFFRMTREVGELKFLVGIFMFQNFQFSRIEEKMWQKFRGIEKFYRKRSWSMIKLIKNGKGL